MSGVAERVEDGGDVIRDRIAESEGVVGRNRQVLGEGTRAVDADADGIAPQVAAAGTTVAAVTAGDVALARNAIALFQARSEEHTSELLSPMYLVSCPLLEK